MAEFDIDRLFEEDYLGLKVAAAIGSVSDYWQIVEEFLPVIRDQMSVRFLARMKRDYPNFNKEGLVDHYEGHEWIVNGLLAGLLPGSVLVALWSAFEQSIMAICKYAQNKEGVPFALDDLREKDLGRKLHQYLRILTRQEFRLPHGLSDIQELRNLYAHHNGSLEQLSEQKRARIEAIIRSKNGATLYDKHHVVLSSNYLRESVQKIDECLTAVLKFVEARYPHVEQPKVGPA